ncbi:hypothetical protein [Streptomyces sp. Agncl-13]|uniref:hypothetical protein n=1 Tax=Streptomyces sp. Agncl-13 TaxID=3400628 RepID=UPI003A881401
MRPIYVFQRLLDLAEENAGPISDDTFCVIAQEATNEPCDPVSLLSIVFNGPGVVQ